MWNRKEIKQRAKTAFQNNFWWCVAAAIVTGIAITGLTVTTGYNFGGSVAGTMSNQTVQLAAAAAGAVSLATLLLNIFVFKPLEMGGKKFFLDNSMGRVSSNEIMDVFQVNYMNNVSTMFLRDLITALWTLLFIIPGIVKMYAYRMVPYIAAEHPEMASMDVLRASEQMMRGQKWRAFVLDLSFIGWHILTVLTAGLVGVFYTQPYIFATDAELYLALKEEQELVAA